MTHFVGTRHIYVNIYIYVYILEHIVLIHVMWCGGCRVEGVGVPHKQVVTSPDTGPELLHSNRRHRHCAQRPHQLHRGGSVSA